MQGALSPSAGAAARFHPSEVELCREVHHVLCLLVLTHGASQYARDSNQPALSACQYPDSNHEIVLACEAARTLTIHELLAIFRHVKYEKSGARIGSARGLLSIFDSPCAIQWIGTAQKMCQQICVHAPGFRPLPDHLALYYRRAEREKQAGIADRER